MDGQKINGFIKKRIMKNSPLLSILIPTVVGRELNLCRLMEEIWLQQKAMYNGSDLVDVEFIKDNKEMTIGEKRGKLYQMANGLYSWQIDDDDSIADNAIQLILEAIKSNPDVDVISFEEYVNIDGKEYKSNHHGKYLIWEGDGNSIFEDGFHFHRTPFFKSVIRTGLAKKIQIPHIRFGEDNIFADNLLPNIRTEHHISEQLYRYIHISSPHNERYGFDRD